jgi:short-subunit dehydrogenase
MPDKQMANAKRSVLITGCSDGGLGAALAVAFQEAGLHVYATARNPTKMKQLEGLGIETLTLDVLSDTSIAACVSKLSSLDILVNNAGAQYTMPVSDLSIPEARKLFDLNVWSYVAVTQAFLPLLLKSKGMIVNQTSISSVISLPFAAAYCASKAAIATLSDALRQELVPFGVTVVDLKTGVVKSNLIKNRTGNEATNPLPEESIYAPAREKIGAVLRQDEFVGQGFPSDKWAKAVVRDLLRKKVPPLIWRGEQVWLAWIGTFLPFGAFDGMFRKMAGLDVVEQMVKK